MSKLPFPPPALQRAFNALNQAQEDLAQAVTDTRASGQMQLNASIRSILCACAASASITRGMLQSADESRPPSHELPPAPAGADGLYLMLRGAVDLAEGLMERLDSHGCPGPVCPLCEWEDVVGQTLLLVQVPADAMRALLPDAADIETCRPKLIGLAKAVLAGCGEGPLERGQGDWRGEPECGGA